jgi:hypothetical protein
VDPVDVDRRDKAELMLDREEYRLVEAEEELLDDCVRLEGLYLLIDEEGRLRDVDRLEVE